MKQVLMLLDTPMEVTIGFDLAQKTPFVEIATPAHVGSVVIDGIAMRCGGYWGFGCSPTGGRMVTSGAFWVDRAKTGPLVPSYISPSTPCRRQLAEMIHDAASDILNNTELMLQVELEEWLSLSQSKNRELQVLKQQVAEKDAEVLSASQGYVRCLGRIDALKNGGE